MAAQGDVGLQQVLGQVRHVGVGRVHLVHHQQAARQQGMAHVGVLGLQGAQQRLVHGAHGNGRGQKPLGRFGGPAALGVGVLGVVVPQHLKARQGLVAVAVCRGVTGQGAHHQRRIAGPCLGDEALDALAQLRGRHPGGQREIQAIDLARAPQLQKAPQGGFGFAAAGFGLQHHDVPGRLSRRQLHGARGGQLEHGRKIVAGGTLAGFGLRHGQANGAHGVLRACRGGGGAHLARLAEWEKTRAGVRTQPVGQLHQPGKAVRKPRRIGQRGQTGRKRQRVLRLNGLPHLRHGGCGVVHQFGTVLDGVPSA